MAVKGFLIDVTKCIGCRACQVACKRYHDLGPDDAEVQAAFADANRTTFLHTADWTNPPDRDANTWLLIKFKELDDSGEFMWRFLRDGCKHCLNPQCIQACPQDAITKDTEHGAVTTDAGKCIGCESCIVGKGLEGRVDLGCRFDVPRYGKPGDYDETVMGKCSMCLDRVQDGLIPACAHTCPTGAITFGDRAAMLTEAETRIAAGGYENYIYGKDEGGGTSVFIIADKHPIDDLGLHDVPAPTAPTLGPFKYSGGEVIASATVTVGSLTATTDANGLAAFTEAIPSGDHDIVVTKVVDSTSTDVITTDLHIAADGTITYGTDGTSAPANSALTKAQVEGETTTDGDGEDDEDGILDAIGGPLGLGAIVGAVVVVGAAAAVGLHKRKQKIAGEKAAAEEAEKEPEEEEAADETEELEEELGEEKKE